MELTGRNSWKPEPETNLIVIHSRDVILKGITNLLEKSTRGMYCTGFDVQVHDKKLYQI